MQRMTQQDVARQRLMAAMDEVRQLLNDTSAVKPLVLSVLALLTTEQARVPDNAGDGGKQGADAAPDDGRVRRDGQTEPGDGGARSLATASGTDDLFQILAALVPVAVCVSNAASRIVYANGAWMDLAGQNPGEDGLADWQKVIHPDDRERVTMEIRCAREARRPFTVRHRVRREDGSVLAVKICGSPRLDMHGQLQGYVVVVIDMTVEIEAEFSLLHARQHEEQAEKFKTHLMSALSHELRTPLNGILGLLEELRDETQNVEHVKIMDGVLYSTRRLADTLKALLHYAEIESNRLSTTVRRSDVAAIVHKAADTYRPLARAKGLEIMVETDVHSLKVMADEQCLSDALGYVVDNAVKFTTNGDVQIALRTFKDGGVPHAEITVRDTGIGIKPMNLGVVLEPFRQESEGFSREHEGSGIGLTLSKRLVEKMHGTLSLRSIPGEGTIVALRIPVGDPAGWDPGPGARSARPLG